MPLRSDSFLFMRKAAVDLSRYLPQWLYNDKIFAALQGALNWEHENYRLKLGETARQFYIETADSGGLQDWERLLKIAPKDLNDLDLRRRVAKVRFSNVTMTLENTKKMLQEFAPVGTADIEELGDFQLKLIINDGRFYFDELLEALWRYLPAHLVFSFDINRDFGEEVIHIAQPVAVADREKFALSLEDPPPLIIAPSIIPVDISADEITHFEPVQALEMTLATAFVTCESENVEIAAEDEVDGETWALWLQYLKMHYRRFYFNPVIRHYSNDGAEIEDDDFDEATFEGNFLKLWLDYHEDEKTRLIVIPFPHDDLKASEINAVNVDGVFINRRGKLSRQITRAVMVKKSITTLGAADLKPSPSFKPKN